MEGDRRGRGAGRGDGQNGVAGWAHEAGCRGRGGRHGNDTGCPGAGRGPANGGALAGELAELALGAADGAAGDLVERNIADGI